MKARVFLTSSEGFRVLMDTDRISAVGIDPPQKEKIFVICGDKEYTSTRNTRGQFKRIIRNLHGMARSVSGFNRHD